MRPGGERGPQPHSGGEEEDPPEILRGQAGTVVTLIEQHLGRLAVLNTSNGQTAQQLLSRAEPLTT
ncbi:MAG: hypothetical protein WDO73_31895 [Ignavibacteriota bacterium]